MNIIGDVRGKVAVIIDDEVDTAGSLMEAVGRAQAGGATAIYSMATHGVFSGSALERINGSAITEVVVTDTIPLPPGVDDSRITVLSVAPLFGEAIRRIHRGESVGRALQLRGRDGRGDDLLVRGLPRTTTHEPFRIAAG